jgi:hypothetical protein
MNQKTVKNPHNKDGLKPGDKVRVKVAGNSSEVHTIASVSGELSNKVYCLGNGAYLGERYAFEFERA